MSNSDRRAPNSHEFWKVVVSAALVFNVLVYAARPAYAAAPGTECCANTPCGACCSGCNLCVKAICT